MKSNLKKLAIMAGVAMAAGSMSANAVITSVPAPAQLIPLFYYNNTNAATGNIDTTVRVFAPKSVGADTVINLLGGSLVSATALSSTSPAFVTSVGDGIAYAKIHYIVLDQNSVEVVDGSWKLTPDDEFYTEASDYSILTSGTPYYLVLVNETAFSGGNPTFQFGADAWINNISTPTSATLPAATAIPVLGMTDTADTTAYPTPTNNVIEDRGLTSATTGSVIASPIHTAIRTSSSTTGLKFRVVDVPVFSTCVGTPCAQGQGYTNTLVAWADSNVAQTGFATYSKNGLSGTLTGVDGDEGAGSLGTFSFPKQLNIVRLGYSGTEFTTNVLGISDKYSVPLNSANSLGKAKNGGFLKLTIDAPAVPTGATAPGAYSSVVLFNIPVGGINEVTEVEPDTATAIFALDTGFYTTN